MDDVTIVQVIKVLRFVDHYNDSARADRVRQLSNVLVEPSTQYCNVPMQNRRGPRLPKSLLSEIPFFDGNVRRDAPHDEGNWIADNGRHHAEEVGARAN